MAHAKATAHQVMIRGEPVMIIWRTGYVDFFAGKVVKYRYTTDSKKNVQWRLAIVRGTKDGIVYLKEAGMATVAHSFDEEEYRRNKQRRMACLSTVG